jgi:hypothetical protein
MTETQQTEKPTREWYGEQLTAIDAEKQAATQQERELRGEIQRAEAELEVAHRDFAAGGKKPTHGDLVRAMTAADAETKLKQQRGELPVRTAARPASNLDASAIASKGNSIESPHGSAFRRGASPNRGPKLPSDR